MSPSSAFKSFLTGVWLVATSVTFAQTTKEPARHVVDIRSTRLVGEICLVVKKQLNRAASVQLLTPNGEMLYEASLAKEEVKYRQFFDLNELEVGTYTIRIKQGKDIIVRAIHVRTATSTRI